jgi:hypothetical protein
VTVEPVTRAAIASSWVGEIFAKSVTFPDPYPVPGGKSVDSARTPKHSAPLAVRSTHIPTTLTVTQEDRFHHSFFRRKLGISEKEDRHDRPAHP